MRTIGTTAYGIRLPIISSGDDLPEIVADCIVNACEANGLVLKESDVIGVTEAIVAKAQGNYVKADDLAADIREKFPKGAVGVVFPILSRNRFLNILKGISKGAEKVYVLLNCPSDEVGNPIMDINDMDDLEAPLSNGLIPAAEFKRLTGNFKHPFTGIDYISLYEHAGDNIEVFVSNDPRNILSLTKNVLIGEIHTRFYTKARLIKAGAETVYTLSDVLNKPVNGSGFNPDYGVLGSNLSTDNVLKLFPRNCDEFVINTRRKIKEKTGVAPELLIYGDGAFKDPACGIWELADPVVSPAFTEKLGGKPTEMKLKFVADNIFSHLSGNEKTQAVSEMIKDKKSRSQISSEGTTPRKYADLLGSLCDLMSGSGDKGTPVILIKGYFDDYASE